MAINEGDNRYPCCRKAGNLYEAERRDVPDGVLVTLRCKECNRRHFVMQAEPKSFGITGH